MHRVVPPPGAQRECERYSFAYVLKPPDGTRMSRWGGIGGVIPRLGVGERDWGDCTYGEFHARKAAGIRAGKNLQGGVEGGEEVVKEVNGVH